MDTVYTKEVNGQTTFAGSYEEEHRERPAFGRIPDDDDDQFSLLLVVVAVQSLVSGSTVTIFG